MEKIILDKLEEINLKIYKIQKKQEELFAKYDLLLTEQKKENKDIYKILQQLLLKDLLSTYKNEMTSFLSEKNISDKNDISENLEIKEPELKEKDKNISRYVEVNNTVLKEKDINTEFVEIKDYEINSFNKKEEFDLYELYEKQFE